MVRRVFVEKKKEYAIKAEALLQEMKGYLGINGVNRLRILVRYDVENIPEDSYEKAVETIFSEPPVDEVYYEEIPGEGVDASFAVEYLPGQFDQRADSAMQCVGLLCGSDDVIVRTAIVYLIEGGISENELKRFKEYCINPVDSRQARDDKPDTLVDNYDEPADVAILDGFTEMPEEDFKKLFEGLSLAMTYADFNCIREYFRKEERNPSISEIRVLDTYWSDHCRHTTFATELKDIRITDGDYRTAVAMTYDKYLDTFNEMYRNRSDKYTCLMDIATLAAKKLKKDGKLDDLEESEEINACSVVVNVDVDGKDEEWLLNFKNETHNHPTEIEPFGGAATCLGGAIRDPLSGRTYVYQAMRVTGAADPTGDMADTLPGKLPQKKIVTDAAHGYSSYGNQIGLATGLVDEIYHPGYVAKRMEIGAVMAAAPRRAVKRLSPTPGDVIIMIGGRTGRDGCGGATGSSKAHDSSSIDTCGAEVQKGNPPTERKLQRLFRREEVSSIIKKCNDFGAGGVSVAIGELADGLLIDLDKVPKKYAGLDGTELSISESQERMACVIAPENVKAFLRFADEENLEAVEVAKVTEEKRLILTWRGKEIVNLSREFLDTNGAHQETEVLVSTAMRSGGYFKQYGVRGIEDFLEIGDVRGAWFKAVSDLNSCSRKGLVERFDSSIGAGSVYMPFGGRNQLTPTQTMVAKIPVQGGSTNSVSVMSYGFDPYMSSWSTYHGAIYAVLSSISKIVASGADYKKIRFSFQEYFGRMTNDPYRWGLPFAALLGAFDAQLGFGLPAIGGKDSMSGTFNDIDVPPTLCSFAVTMAKEEDIITPELKRTDSKLCVFRVKRDMDDKPDYRKAMKLFDAFISQKKAGNILSAYSIGGNGMAVALSQMAFGNGIGVTIDPDFNKELLFMPVLGDIIAEVRGDRYDEFRQDIKDFGVDAYVYIVGETNDRGMIEVAGAKLRLDEVREAWEKPLESVFPTKASGTAQSAEISRYNAGEIYICKNKVAKPTVFIPVFPGTNCEYDSARAFERAGANVEIRVLRNLNASAIADSVDEFAKTIKQSQIIMFPGGFSAGDEPEGSAKFFATAFRNERLKEEVTRLLNERDGLMLGICNGFQALIKLGLVPYGQIQTGESDSPTLTYNTIGRHVSKMAYLKVVSNKSPWLKNAEIGKVYVNPVSHGEGRFVADSKWIAKLVENGQVATQYCDPDGRVTMDDNWNVNGSYMSIEGITSPDGRIYGKMAHSERIGAGVAKNIFGEQDMKLFESGVEYFM